MCIPHQKPQKQQPILFRRRGDKKHKSKPFNRELIRNGDPDFVDERVIIVEIEKKSLFKKLFG